MADNIKTSDPHEPDNDPDAWTAEQIAEEVKFCVSPAGRLRCNYRDLAFAIEIARLRKLVRQHALLEIPDVERGHLPTRAVVYLATPPASHGKRIALALLAMFLVVWIGSSAFLAFNVKPVSPSPTERCTFNFWVALWPVYAVAPDGLKDWMVAQELKVCL